MTQEKHTTKAGERTHTPGPWTTTGSYIYGRNDEDVATVNEIADANLIAAAPMLLAQLKALCEQIKTIPMLGIPPNVTKAIAQAEGRA